MDKFFRFLDILGAICIVLLLVLYMTGCSSKTYEPWYREQNPFKPDPLAEAERAMFEMNMARCAGLDVSIVECLYGI